MLVRNCWSLLNGYTSGTQRIFWSFVFVNRIEAYKTFRYRYLLSAKELVVPLLFRPRFGRERCRYISTLRPNLLHRSPQIAHRLPMRTPSHPVPPRSAHFWPLTPNENKAINSRTLFNRFVIGCTKWRRIESCNWRKIVVTNTTLVQDWLKSAIRGQINTRHSHIMSI
jgi:hypothetical protein